MKTQSLMQDDQVVEIIESVTGAMLGNEAGPVRQANLSLPIGETIGLTAYVTVSGTWNGAVSIHCTHDAARHIGASMFGRPPQSLSDDELRDAVGELCNMVGGNLKSLAASLEDGACRLSLPLVADGEVRVLGATLIHRSIFTCHGFPATVQILERPSARLQPDVTASTT
jgi:chemotaxis protein CheX